MQLQGQRGPDHFLLEQRRNVALLHPVLPVARGLVPEALAQRRERLFHRRAPTEHQVLSSGQRERLAPEVGKGEVGGEPQLAGESLEANMMRTVHHRRPLFGPAQPWLADHGDAGRAFDGFDDPHQLRRPERAAELQKPRREIDHPEGARRGSKCRFEDVRVRQVALRAGFAARGTDPEAPAILAVQKRGAHRLGIEPRQTAPDDLSAVVHQRGKLAVPDHSQVFELHVSHTSIGHALIQFMPRMAQFILTLLLVDAARVRNQERVAGRRAERSSVGSAV